MAAVEVRAKSGKTIMQLDRVPVRDDYLYQKKLWRVLAVVLTPSSNVAAVALVQEDPDGVPDELKQGMS